MMISNLKSPIKSWTYKKSRLPGIRLKTLVHPEQNTEGMNRKEQILQMLQADAEDAFLRYALALEFEKEANILEAIKTLQALKSSSPSYLGLYLKLAQLLTEINQLAEASMVLHNGISLAKEQGNRKAQGELNELLLAIEDE